MIHTQLIKPVPQLLREQAAKLADKTAFRDGSSAVPYAQLDRATANLAGHLQDAGIAEGDSVAIFLPNSVQWIETCFATLRAGAVAVPISVDATEPEVVYRIEDADCKAIV